MVFTNEGRSGLALAWGGSTTYPDVIAIGSGSGAVAVTRTGLIAELDSNAFTGSVDLTSVNEAGMTADFGATAMSGVNLREFGVQTSGSTLWNIEGFDAVAFDGSIELQIQIIFEVF